MVYNDDCLNFFRKIDNDSVDMIYLDPPFYTQRKQKLSNSDGKVYQFSDTWESKDTYCTYIKERLAEMRRVLKKEGSIFLHCDTSASHYLRMILDDIFGESNFRSEIIWSYKRWSNSQKALIPNHQTIFFYSKTRNYKFNTIYTEYSATTNIDQILQERERNSYGKSTYKKNTYGEIVPAKEKRGVPLSDVWEIPFLNPKAKERTGYPTQKPIELLDRIIKISTDEGDLVLDPFCGSGTTLVSAKLLNRRYIGVDISKQAVELTNSRIMNPIKSNSLLLKNGIDSYKTKTKDELLILQQLECDIVQRNKGIDAFLKKHYLDAPVAIKIQKENEDLSETIKLLKNAGEKKNCSFTICLSSSSSFTNLNIPSNMLVIPKYMPNIEAELNNKITQIAITSCNS